MINAWLLLATAGLLSAQDPARLAEARTLSQQLTGNPTADRAILLTPHAAELFAELMRPGQSFTATDAQYADLHLAINGLVELSILEGSIYKAAVYESFNETYYRNQKNYEGALQAARRSLVLSVQGGQFAHTWLDHQTIAHDLMSLGRPAEALVEQRLSQLLLPDPYDKAAGQLGRDITQTLLALNRLPEAEAQVAEMEAAPATADPLYRCRAAFSRADVLFAQHRFREGSAAAKAGLALVPPGKDREFAALDANALLLTASVDGVSSASFEEATKLAHDAETEIPGFTVPLQSVTSALLRRRRLLSGDIEGVLREDAERVEAARKSGNLYGQIEALQSLAASYAAVNGTRAQSTLLEEALAIEKPTLGPTGIPADAGAQLSYYRTLDSLGWSYLAQTKIAPARNAFDQMLKGIATYPDVATRDRLRNLRASAVLGKARVAELSDEPEDARALLLGALREGAGTRSNALLQLARLERVADEKPALAATYYEQSIEALSTENSIAQQTATRLSYARYLLTKAAQRVPDAPARAQAQLAEVEKVLPGLNYAEGEWRLQYLRGIALETTDPEAAIAAYKKAIDRLDRIRATLTQQDLRQGLLNDDSVADLSRRLVAAFTRTAKREEAWRYLERAKARTFLDALAGRRFGKEAPELLPLTELEHQIDSLRLELAPNTTDIFRGGVRETSLIAAELKTLEARYTVAREQSSLRTSRAGQVLSVNPPTLADTARRVPPGTALIEYGLLEGKLTAFVVTALSMQQISWVADTEALRRDTLRLHRAAQNPASTDVADLIATVSTALIKPLAVAIPAGITNLLIVPSTYLNYIPFGMLLTPDGNPLLTRFAVGYLPSAGALQYLHPRKPGLQGLFLGALGNQSADGMPPLPGTIAETEAIRTVYPAAKLLTGAAFTHDSARAALLSNANVHFATHGLLDEEAPLFSALLTAPSPKNPSRLSLYELTGLPLRATTVVLSACETGLGTMLGGDEISGLTRTFLTAGADTVVSSLWKVSDESTALLMTNFYRRLNQGAAPAQSLREAALAVRKIYPHPFYWAPFIVTGVN